MQYLLQPEIRKALSDGSYGAACDQAIRDLSALNLEQGLGRVFAARAQPIICDARATHWLLLMIERRRLSLHHLHWAAERLTELREPFGSPEDALHRLLSERW